MDSDLRDELQSIEAIYCADEDEFCVELYGLESGKDTVFSMYISHVNKPYTCCSEGTTISDSNKDEHDEAKKTKIKCVFTISSTYPQTIPEISFSSIDHAKVSLLLLKKDTIAHSKELKGKPMLLDILMWLQDNITKYNSDNISDSEQSVNINVNDKIICKESFVTAILQLDHMRSRNKYLKTLEKWSCEIGVAAVVIFQQRLIVIILQGNNRCVKDFIVRQKTVNVDVDSKGRSCKERMLSLMAEVPFDDKTQRLHGFQVQEFSSNRETEEYFLKVGLEKHYKVIMNKV